MIATRLAKTAYSSANSVTRNCQGISRGLKTLLIAEHAAGALLPGKPLRALLNISCATSNFLILAFTCC